MTNKNTLTRGLTLSALTLSCFAFAVGCSDNNNNGQQFPVQSTTTTTVTTTTTATATVTVTPTTTPTVTPTPKEYVYTANNDGTATSSFSVLSTQSGAVTLTGNSPGGLGANLISVVSGQPVAVAIENNSNNIYGNLTTYAVNATTGGLTFLSDQTAAFVNAFPGFDGVVDFASQYAFPTQTVAYVLDDNSFDIGAFSVQESGTREGTLSFLGASSQVASGINNSALVSSGGNNVLLTLEGDESYGSLLDGDAALESWQLNSDGSFSTIGGTAASTIKTFGDASNLTGLATFTTSSGTFAVVTSDGNAAGDNNVFVFQVASTGVLTQVATAQSVTGGADNTIPIGVVVEQVNGSPEAFVVQQDGVVTAFPLSASGVLGTAVTTQPPTGIGLGVGGNPVADSVLQGVGTTFHIIITATANDFIEQVTVNATSGAVTFSETPVSTQSSGAGFPGPEVNGSAAVFLSP